MEKGGNANVNWRVFSIAAISQRGVGVEVSRLINLTPEPFVWMHLKPIKNVNNKKITQELLSLRFFGAM